MSCSTAAVNSATAMSLNSISNIGSKFNNLIVDYKLDNDTSWSSTSSSSPSSSTTSSLPSTPPASSASNVDPIQLIRIDHTSSSSANINNNTNSSSIFTNSNLTSPFVSTASDSDIIKVSSTPPTTSPKTSKFPKYGKFKKFIQNKKQPILSEDEEDNLLLGSTTTTTTAAMPQNEPKPMKLLDLSTGRSRFSDILPKLEMVCHFTVELVSKKSEETMLVDDRELGKNGNYFLYEAWKQRKLIDTYLYSNDISSHIDDNQSDSQFENNNSLQTNKPQLIPAHRRVLCSHSKYFQQFFESYTKMEPMPESNVKNIIPNGAASSTFQKMLPETVSLMSIARTSVPVCIALPIAADILNDLVKLTYCAKIEINGSNQNLANNQIDRLRKAAKFLKMDIRIRGTNNAQQCKNEQPESNVSPKQSQQSASLSSCFSKLSTTTAGDLNLPATNRLSEIFKFPALSPSSVVSPRMVPYRQSSNHHNSVNCEVGCPISPTLFSSLSSSPSSSSSLSSSSASSSASLPLAMTSFSTAFSSQFGTSSPPPALSLPAFRIANQAPEPPTSFQYPPDFSNLIGIGSNIGINSDQSKFQIPFNSPLAKPFSYPTGGLSTLAPLPSPSELDQFYYFDRPPLQSPQSPLSLFRPLFQRQYSAPANLISVQDLSTMMNHQHQQLQQQLQQQQQQPVNLATSATSAPLALVTTSAKKPFHSPPPTATLTETPSVIKRSTSQTTLRQTTASKAISNCVKNRILSRHLSYESSNNNNNSQQQQQHQFPQNLINKQLDYLNAIASATVSGGASINDQQQFGRSSNAKGISQQSRLTRSVSSPSQSTGLNCRKRYQNLYHAAKYRDRRRQRTEQLFTEKESLEKTQNTYTNMIGSLKTSILSLVQGKTRQLTETGECFYRCPICMIVFLDLEKIRQHLIVGHRELVRISVDNCAGKKPKEISATEIAATTK